MSEDTAITLILFHHSAVNHCDQQVAINLSGLQILCSLAYIHVILNIILYSFATISCDQYMYIADINIA